MVLQNRNFSRLLAALAVSQLGDWLYNVALLGYVFERTHSPTWLALTTAARVLPVVVLGPVAGILGDRFDRRLVMVASDVVRMAMMAGLAVVVVTGAPVVLVPLLAALATAAAAPYAPCVAASVPRIVERDQLTSANSWRAAIGPMAIVTGPALGAVVLAVTSPAWAFVVNGGTFALSALLTVTLRPREAFRPTGPAASVEGLWGSVTAGARELFRRPVAARLVGADLLCSFCYGVQTVALVAVAARLGHAGSGYGVLLAAAGLGGLVGAALAGRVQRFAGRSATVVGALLVLAAAMPLTAVLPGFAGVATAVLAAGAASLVVEVLTETTLAEQLDDEVFARAYGFAYPAAIAGIVAGSLVAAPLVSALGLTGALAATGALVAAYAGWLVTSQSVGAPTLRRTLSVVPLALALVALVIAFTQTAASADPDLSGRGKPGTVAVDQTLSAKMPASADSLTPPLAGYTLVQSEVINDPADAETFGSVDCPSGRVTGGGAIIGSGSLAENINSSFPTVDGSSWEVYIHNRSDTDGTFVVYAVCAKKIKGYTVTVGAGVANDPGTEAAAGVQCPRGKVPYGGGALGTSSELAANLNSSIPQRNGWLVDFNNASTSPNTAQAYVVCGKKATGYTQVSGATRLNPANTQSEADVTCPSGTSVFGGGLLSTAGARSVNLNSTAWSGSTGWTGWESNASDEAAAIIPYAVCATVA